MRDQNFYELMGFSSKQVSTTQIKTRYRYLVKQYHPDRKGDQSKMVALNIAYETLSDPVKRLQYNRSLKDQDDIKETNLKSRPQPPKPRSSSTTTTNQPAEKSKNNHQFSYKFILVSLVIVFLVTIISSLISINNSSFVITDRYQNIINQKNIKLLSVKFYKLHSKNQINNLPNNNAILPTPLLNQQAFNSIIFPLRHHKNH